jgi:hypothetical protein
MEADILKSLSFEMGNPTIKTFLRQGHHQHVILFVVYQSFMVYRKADWTDCFCFLPF